MSKILTIAICTYNRKELLSYCLDAIYPQINHDVELLVVDNGTESVQELCSNYTKLKYIKERETGLSFARNRSIAESDGEWILYLDDDAKAYPNFVEVALKLCKQGHMVFGGVYHPWYHFGKPKWFKDEYASNKMPYHNQTVLPEGKYLSGGIMAYHKSLFAHHGNFLTNIGMIGNKIGYGEESEIQDRFRNAGHPLIYEPTLEMEHVVAEYKLSVSWFLKSNFNRGKDMAKYSKKPLILDVLSQVVIAFGLLAFHTVTVTPRLLKSSYYIENWEIDVLKKFYKRIGYIYQRFS